LELLQAIALPGAVGAFAALALCLARMPIARTMALVDVSDHPRKAHVGAVPLVGGIAMFPAIAIACVQAVALGASEDAFGMMVGVVFGFFMIGYADDRMQIRPSRRLLLTLVLFAALVLMTPAFMPSIFEIGGLQLQIGPGTIALLAIIGASGALNAINMADGQDGLCVGLLLIWLLFLTLESTTAVQSAALLAALALAVVLMFNLLGLVFLGDIGAYGVGAFVLSLMLYGAGDGSIDHGQIVALLAVPVVDCIFLMIERARRGNSPYDPDRQHLHHILQATFGKWPSLAVYLGAVGLCAVGACQNGWATPAAIACAIAFVVVSRWIGRREVEVPSPAETGSQV